MTPPGLLIYDADCGFCTASARWYAEKAGPTGSVAPWQELDLAEHRLTEEQASASVQWSHNGTTVGGADAVANALQTTSGFWRIIGKALAIAPLSWLARTIYPVIARNRHRLPGSTDACRLNLKS